MIQYGWKLGIAFVSSALACAACGTLLPPNVNVAQRFRLDPVSSSDELGQEIEGRLTDCTLLHDVHYTPKVVPDCIVPQSTMGSTGFINNSALAACRQGTLARAILYAAPVCDLVDSPDHGWQVETSKAQLIVESHLMCHLRVFARSAPESREFLNISSSGDIDKCNEALLGQARYIISTLSVRGIEVSPAVP
jgi:hypothetical protein